MMKNEKSTGIQPARSTDVYQLVTDRIISALEKGIIPWKKTWESHFGFPQNYLTKHRYRGINAVLTGLTEQPSPYFLTFNQANELGGRVKKGSVSIPIVYWNVSYKDKDGKTVAESDLKPGHSYAKRFYARYYRVFNIGDIEKIEFSLPEPKTKDNHPLVHCETLIQRMPNPPAIQEGGDRACYSPPLDQVKVPKIEQFHSSEEYYATLFHELIHSTGHTSRLSRPEVMEAPLFGSCDYSKEELTAEMGAAFLCNLTGINHLSLEQNSVAYIQSWLQVLKNEKKFVFAAATKAQQAVDYLIGDNQPKG